MEIIDYIYLLIELELNVRDIYRVFAENNDEDYIFWIQLSNEEDNHATLLRTCIEFINSDLDVSNMIPDDIDNIIEVNKKLLIIKQEYLNTLGRELSFQIAMNIETSASESHYQDVMTDENSENKILNIIQKLNREDINHYCRIRKYYESIYDKEL